MPVYWKPTYATRSRRHRAFVQAQARREAALRARTGPSLWERLRARFTRAA